jgi:hypothetical protein
VLRLVTMDLVPVQVCRTTEGWSPVQIESHSAPGFHYTVLVNPFVTKKEFVCDCKGFEYRGTCRHQTEALSKVCWWPIVPRNPQFEQTDQQKRDKVCPNCSGPTKWEMIDADEET